MSQSYECADCYRIVDDEEVYNRPTPEKYEFWGESVIRNSYTAECPYCGCSDLEEVQICDQCGFNVAMKDEDWCEECLGKHVKPNPLDPWMDALRSELDQMVRR